LPAVPPRLLSSASAPALAPASSTGLTIEDIVIVPSEYNPEADPLYQETWDAYWARVRPQRSRPYHKPQPPAPSKGGCLVVVVYLCCLWSNKKKKGGAVNLCWMRCTPSPLPLQRRGEERKVVGAT
jgi:hypothetical protein